MPSPSDPKQPLPPTLIAQFRAKTVRQNIHFQEKILLWLVSLHLVFLAWALGGMREWGQWTGLALGALSFGVALAPRDYGEATPGQAPFKLYTWPKLLRFPLFWLGVVLFAIIAIAGLNPAWTYVADKRTWWIEPAAHLAWLPSGVRAPFDRGGPWRMLVIYGGAWLAVCSVWIGFTRRKTYQSLFAVLASNAFLLALFGIAQKATATKLMFWFWQPPAAYFVASFTYKNHAGAYFNLMLSVCAGLAFWHYERSQRRLDKSGPSGLFAFFGTAVAMIVVFSYSRSATALMFAFLLTTLGIFVWRMFITARAAERRPAMLLMLMLIFISFVGVGLLSLRTAGFVESLSRIPEESETLNGRTIVTQAAWKMAQDRPVLGWGAGSFRFCFPIYQRNYPAIFMSDGRRLYWEHAHNDYIEWVAEFGLIGCLLVLAGAGFVLWNIVRHRVWENGLALFLMLGCGVTLAHALVDFNFYNPAILTSWGILLFGTIRWVELEELATGG